MSKTTRRVYKIAAAAAFTAGSVAAIPATFAAEAPADQQQQVVDQKASSQASSLPGGNATETPKAEAPKTEAPKAEATEAPKVETPKAEAPKTDATEAPKAETPAPTAPATEAPKAETPKAEATEAPKTEAPKAETPAPTAPATEAPKAETPAPTAPATPEPTTPATPTPEAKQADPSIVIENAHFPGDAQLNTVSVVGTGFYGEKVGPGVQVSIYALDADNQITGDALATIAVPADQIQDGTFKTSITVEASKLPAGASYALAAVSNPQGQPDQKLVAISSFKVTESTSSEAPKTETPKADETPAPVTPAPETPKADETPAPEAPKTEAPKEETPAPEAPKAETPAPEQTETPAPETPAAPENATLTTEDASLDPNDQYNVLTFNGSGFTHESVANGVQIAIFRLDANGNITGEALATHDIPASEIVNGTFRVKVSVLAELLQPGYAYAMVATSDPNGLVHQVAVTTATVSDANNPAPTLPAATEDEGTTVRDNGDGTTSVFTAEMREDGSVVVTETRMPSSQAPKAKVGNASAATSSNSNGHTVGVSGTKGSASTSSSASSKPQLAHTGAEGVAGIAGVGAAALIAGAALMLLRRRSL